jgi:hypothetical protein
LADASASGLSGLAGIFGSGGNAGGGACSRSITDLATSAAERIVSGFFFGTRGFTVLGAPAFLAALLVFATLLVLAALVLAAASAADVRIAGLSFRVAAGLGLRALLAAAASTLRRACFAAFFSALNNLRACLSRAFAARTSSLAADARAEALVAAALSRLMIGDLVVIYGSTRNKN